MTQKHQIQLFEERKVRPLLDDAWKADFQNIWSDILNMHESRRKSSTLAKRRRPISTGTLWVTSSISCSRTAVLAAMTKSIMRVKCV